MPKHVGLQKDRNVCVSLSKLIDFRDEKFN
jgi:hypothetical protein